MRLLAQIWLARAPGPHSPQEGKLAAQVDGLLGVGWNAPDKGSLLGWNEIAAICKYVLRCLRYRPGAPWVVPYDRCSMMYHSLRFLVLAVLSSGWCSVAGAL